MNRRSKRIGLSIVAGVAALAIAWLPIPYVEFLLFPGMLLSSPFWPYGVHTSGISGTGVRLMIVTIYTGTAAFWGGIAYAILKKRDRYRI